ncbi:alpha-tocopherol transfer protein-like [Trichonephila clavata]|uniref:Alpha-tocopherol transfer protein-like n=1 Tax=Trichonephila clavata TaxID=2740835 RepID=A0A8X6FB88_TRICU|nr:alpha-tocopherol transfer protein-like [Trichonephila clavata]
MNSILRNPITQLYGVTAIIDYSGFQYRSLFAYSPRLLHILVDTLQVFIHPSNDKWKSLHDSFDLDILPEEFGGYVKQSDMIDLLADVEDMEEELLEHLNFGFLKTKQQREMKRLNPPIKGRKSK